jgi:chemotaxis protein histidine kinase CheA
MGKEETRELLCDFRAGLLELLAELPRLDAGELPKRAHRLAGSAGALGFEPVSDVARAVEHTVRLRGDATEAVAAMRVAIERTLRELDDVSIDRWLAA